MILRRKVYQALFVVLLVGGIVFHKSAEFIVQKFPHIFGVNSYIVALGFVYLILTISVLEYFVFYRIKHVNARLQEAKNSKYSLNKKVLDASKEDEIGNISEKINEMMTKHSQTIKELKKSDEMYMSVTEDAPLLICRFNANGEITFANEPYCKLYGTSKEAIIGTNVYELIDSTGGDSNTVKRKVEMLRPEKDKDTCFHNAPTSPDDDKPEWAMWVNRAFFDEYGRTTEYQSVGLDIYQQAATGLNDMMNDILSLVYFVSKDGDLDYASPTNKTVLGHDPSSLIGKNILDYIHDENKEDIKEQLNNRFLKKENNTSIKELRIKNNKNQYTWIQAAIDSIVTSNGSVSNVAINARDITELKMAHEKISQAFDSMKMIIKRVDTLEFIIERSPVISFVWKKDSSSIEYVSGNISLLGYDKEDFTTGKISFNDLIHPQESEIVLEHMKDSSTEGEEPGEIKYRLIDKNGNYHFVKDRTFIAEREDGVVTYYKGIELTS